MNSIEQMRWAKELISEKTNGFMELTVGNIHDDLFIRASDKAMVGLPTFISNSCLLILQSLLFISTILITREAAAKIAAEYFGTSSHYDGTFYDTYSAIDSQGRLWKFMSDASITPQKI